MSLFIFEKRGKVLENTYSGFAAVYDQLMDNTPYDEWTSYLAGVLKKYNIPDGLVAELGCGTGNITERLAAFGYDMIGIDNSPEMLDIAQEKKAENNSSSLYLCQDMREFELYGTVRAVVSLCDSVNYITDEEDLLTVFKLANNYLDPEGLFIFDFNTLHYYRDTVGESTIAEARDDISFIWDNYFDEETGLNELSLSLFLKEEASDLYRRHDELHIQRAYTLEKIKMLIEKAGLVFVDSFSAYTDDKPDDDTDRVLVIAREHGKTL
ncbi:MAG: class I SAM-dependent methyltransferase [Eubacterium sp.]|nr:class I SAM-dependent methyltransferase [Eubacterium sp.]